MSGARATGMLVLVAAAAAFHAPLRPRTPATVAPRLATVRPGSVPLRLATVSRHGLSPVAIAPEADCIDEPSSFACPVDEPPLPENDDWLQQALPVLVLCCAIAAICALDRVVMSVAILPMTEQYGYTDVQKGQIASAFSLGYCLSQLPSGTLAALTSPKQVLVSPHPIPSPNPNPSPSPSPSPSPNPDPDPNPRSCSAASSCGAWHRPPRPLPQRRVCPCSSACAP